LRRFYIGRRPPAKSPTSIRSIPPNLIEGKPCLAVKVSDPETFPSEIT
jgi:hypothetical protein